MAEYTEEIRARASKAVVIIPTYNEAGNVRPITEAVRAAIPDASILIVDDNSPDGTGKLADELAASMERVHVLHRPGKEGLGKAYMDAFRWALAKGYDYLFEFDADFSHNPIYLSDMLAAMAEADVAVGSRYVKGGGTENWGLLRRMISRGGSFYSRTVLGVKVRDLTGGFLCWSRKALETIDLDRVTSAGFAFQIEMKFRAARKGLRIREVPIIFPDRKVGTSKMSKKIFFEALGRVWSLRFRLRREERAERKG